MFIQFANVQKKFVCLHLFRAGDYLESANSHHCDNWLYYRVVGAGGLGTTLVTTNHLVMSHSTRLQPEKLTGWGHSTLAACSGAQSRGILRTGLCYTKLGVQKKKKNMPQYIHVCRPLCETRT